MTLPEKQYVWTRLRQLGLFDHSGLASSLKDVSRGREVKDHRFMAQVADRLLGIERAANPPSPQVAQ